MSETRKEDVECARSSGSASRVILVLATLRQEPCEEQVEVLDTEPVERGRRPAPKHVQIDVASSRLILARSKLGLLNR